MKHSKLFEEVDVAPQLVLRNRIAMAPMTTWASNDDGTVSDDEEEAYYRRRAKDVGLVITGCTHVQENGIGFTGEFAAHDDRFIPSLQRLAAAAQSGGARAFLQIFHAGVKTQPALVADVVGASAVAGEAGPFAPALTPRALREEEILDVIQAFADAARRAIVAGFDGVELHGAHGFLIQNFFSPRTNRRNDRWGGSLENRMRFPLAVVAAVKSAIEEHADRPFALGYRISVDEGSADGLRIADSLQLIDRLIDGGVSYVHASLGSALDQKPVDDTSGRSIVRILHDYVGARVPLIVAGQIRTADAAERVIDQGISLVAVGQGLVMNPDWVAHAIAGNGNDIKLSVSFPDVNRLTIPQKLWTTIEDTPGWFNVVRTQAERYPVELAHHR